jgi:exoribonuclease-2
LDAEGEIRHFDIEEAVIQVDQRLTYESVDTILAGEAHELQALLVQLSKAASALREARIEGGSLTVDRQEVSVHRQDEQTVDVTTYRTDDPSRKLVSEWMIQTCMLTAEWCRERGLATLYRAQTAPNPRPKIPRGRALSRHEQMRILRTMRRAVITTDPEPHNGLGVPAYTQVTSPLRRYADLVMHRQIKDVLATRRQGQGTAQLLELAAHITELHEKHVDIERKSRRYWILRSMESRVGTCFEVEVLRESGRRVIIEVLENNLQTSWEPDSPARRGEVLNLTLTCADARANLLTFRS